MADYIEISTVGGILMDAFMIPMGMTADQMTKAIDDRSLVFKI